MTRQFFCKKCGALVLEVRDGRQAVDSKVTVWCAKHKPAANDGGPLMDFLKGMKK